MRTLFIVAAEMNTYTQTDETAPVAQPENSAPSTTLIEATTGWTEGYHIGPVVRIKPEGGVTHEVIVSRSAFDYAKYWWDADEAHWTFAYKTNPQPTEVVAQPITTQPINRKVKRMKPKSRPKRWADAASRAVSALQELETIQQSEPNERDLDQWGQTAADAETALTELNDVRSEYQDWLDNLPENLQCSNLADKLNAVVDIDVDSALDVVQEAAAYDKAKLEAEELEDLDITGALGTAEEADGADLPLGFGRD